MPPAGSEPLTIGPSPVPLPAGELLRVDMRVQNTGSSAFDFTAALHTYIEVSDVEKAKVRGLKGLDYLDKV